MTDDTLSVDAVVIGAGMAGMTVATMLAQRGREVAVVEAAAEIGGSAALSEGYVWTAPSADVFHEQDPQGDEQRYRRMRDDLDASFAWLTDLSVPVGSALKDVLGFGIGRQVDVGAFFARSESVVESAGGFVLRDALVQALTTRDGRVTGVSIADGEGGTARIDARAVVIATGGFQGDPDARAGMMGEWARELVLRSNPRSRGDGIALARVVEADLIGPADGFYGHLVPQPLDRFEPRDYAALAQYFSEHGILVDRAGQRFTDESLGDHVNAEETAQIGRAVLIVDERIRRTEVMRPFIPGMDAIDKMAAAGARGAHYATAHTVEGLADSLTRWGYDATETLRTVDTFNAALRSGTAPAPPRGGFRHPLDEPPFAAIEVVAAVTFTYRGLAADLDGRVLRGGLPIAGLYAAGADLGGLNVRGYTGGLVRGLTLGRVTAAAIDTDITEAE